MRKYKTTIQRPFKKIAFTRLTLATTLATQLPVRPSLYIFTYRDGARGLPHLHLGTRRVFVN
jgi:hypothetical protein